MLDDNTQLGKHTMRGLEGTDKTKQYFPDTFALFCIHTNTVVTVSDCRCVVSSSVQLRHLVCTVENEGRVLQFLCQVLNILQLAERKAFKQREKQTSSLGTQVKDKRKDQ